jgi:superfamily II DNA or RNA helicase
MGGRGLRAYPGKNDCIILDHGGNTARFGFLADDREFSLEGRAFKEKTAAEIRVTTCKNCFAIFRGPACTACGETTLAAERDVLPETKEGALTELDQAAERSKQRIFYASLLERARAQNYKIEWANHQFKKVYGRYPSPTVTRGLVRKEFERIPVEGGNFKWSFKGYADAKHH